eukprot:m.114396 g.114396  ORF g.114396 m.114396 type:complete len:53 (+) comp37493_c0_seq3:144-302(+)
MFLFLGLTPPSVLQFESSCPLFHEASSQGALQKSSLFLPFSESPHSKCSHYP